MFDVEFPPDLPEDKIRDLIEEIQVEAQKIGLYLEGIMVNIDQETEEGFPKHHGLLLGFTLGDEAFSERVQNPDAEEMKLDTKKFDRIVLNDQIRAILEKGFNWDDDEEEEGEDFETDFPS